MSRSGFKINRHADEIEVETNLPSWLKQFANSQAGKTVVDVIRDRNSQSFVQQISSIMTNSKSKYSSVEEAVKDMRERTGLNKYLENIKASNKINLNKQAQFEDSESDNQKANLAYSIGLRDGLEDIEREQVGDILSNLLSLKTPISVKFWKDYAKGYIISTQMRQNIINEEINKILEYLNKNDIDEKSDYIVNKTAQLVSDRQLPESLAKYTDIAEDIKTYVKNNINNSHGFGLTVPQLQHDLLSVFGVRYGVESQDIMNNEVAKYLSDCIMDAESSVNYEEHESIGDGVGRIGVGDNNDVWEGLIPAK